MNGKLACSIITGAVALSAGIARAQEPRHEELPPPPILMLQGAAPEEGLGPGFGERIELLGFGGIKGEKVVKGAPFSAVAVAESTQTLPDGTHITRTTKTLLFRDSQGRFRKEVTLPAIGPLAASGPNHTFIVIHDPVAGTAYVLEPDQKVARTMNARAAMKGRAHGGEEPAFVAREWKGKGEGTIETKPLGTRTIAEGVTAEGTSHTRTIPVGEIGNDRPISIVSERWYSPELQMVVMSKHSDPRFGDSTYTVTQIQRSEPDASRFTVPSDYTVEQVPAGHLRRRLGASPAEAPAPPPNH
jgi:hypothetical protein